MKIDELLKSTYISAASGLQSSHPKRAAELKKWALEKGESVKIDRIYPHRFDFKNDSIMGWKDELYDDEYFFVTEIKQKTSGLNSGYADFKIYFKSNYGNTIILSFSYNYLKTEHHKPGGWYRIRFENFNDKKVEHNFEFVSRKEAYEFKKCLVEWMEDEELSNEYIDPLKSISINKLYVTK
jgi:hypothetical protein